MADTHGDTFPGPDPARFPNTRLRAGSLGGPSSSRAAPLDTVPSSDPDTCRICRGEGTPEEPLFYPCKCSGSIKFVHQDCLMEWLSHSQKKHCELCKTPFRFTKLYAPDMPKALPFYVFVSHMTKYLFRNVLVWLRGALVVSVWLAWLPYLMRSVWSFLFWISDEGLGEGAALFGRSSIMGRSVGTFSITHQGTAVCSAVCPASPLFAATTTVATVGGVMDGLTLGSMRLVKSLYNINLNATEPIYWTILRFIFGTGDMTDKLASGTSNATSFMIDKALSPSKMHPSLLSEVSFLRNLTRYPSVNRTVIAILEGQIITILVIVCFILIILVRDYVVQQQPDAMRAAFIPAENAVQQPLAEVPEAVPQLHEGWAEPEGWPGGNFQDETIQTFGAGDEESTGNVPHDSDESVDGMPHDPDQVLSGDRAVDGPDHNPHTPTPIALGRELNRRDKEKESATVQDYLIIYRDAGGDPDEILRLARERGVEDKLDYWIRLTRQRLDRDSATEDEGSPANGPEKSVAGLSTSAQIGTYSTSGSPSEWTWPNDEPSSSLDSSSKGKGKLRDDEPANNEHSAWVTGSPLRPRANTDGPIVNDTFNPLANNSWSFTDLPDDYPESSSPFRASRATGEDGDAGKAPVDQVGFSSTAPKADQEAGSSQELPHEDTQDGEQVAPNVTPEVDVPPPRQPADAQLARRPPDGVFNYIADFMWRDVDGIDPAELAAVDLLDEFANDDAVFGDAGPDDLPEEMERDREVVEAAVAAGLDPEAIEDAEDLEGILELLGMRGPVAGLFQNAIFCAFLVSITIFIGIFVPYNIGRITVWMVANPIRPARMIFSLSKFIQDCAVIILGLAASLSSLCVHFVSWMLHLSPVADYFSSLAESTYGMAVSASNRIGTSFITDIPIISTAEMRNFSAISHEALLELRGHFTLGFTTLGRIVGFIFSGNYSNKTSELVAVGLNATMTAWDVAKDIPDVLFNPSSWVINLSLPEPANVVDPELAFWDGTDRFWAIASGYISMTLMAGLYLRRGTPFSSSQTGQEWEAALIDGLNQASGVMKVILIIGIEMLIFPLYCGMLLDIALLPLFEDASVKSRLLFTVNYPVTSVFVHWFVGTGYMFHFALFVSMCRKIMRKGVLYFIRDPDDPEFHPVRDVLERSVTTQLRKIMFSAFVYGALVIVCLGGVVWGLALALPDVLPIHYSSNEPVLEFPIDLLFYNFLMPLAVKFFKPSDGLHVMYTWWFRKCARALRITWFLFGERRVDEEGRLVLRDDSPHQNSPWWAKVLLELDAKGEVVPKTWSDTFEGGTAKPTTIMTADEMITMNIRKIHLVKSGQKVQDGRFVRTPASDQVKIPKGQTVFLEVDENNIRKDGRDIDIYSTNQYQLVYVPPHFKARVFLFILLIWIFAAATGVGITIVPLVFGRKMFKLLLPAHVRTNDIYAFSIGVYILSTAVYTLFHLRSISSSAAECASTVIRSAYNRESVRRVSAALLRVARVVYAYLFLFVAFPLMVSSLIELYAILPLHEFMHSGIIAGGAPSPSTPDQAVDLNPRHTIRIIQGWTLGLLYLRLGSRIIVTWFDHTRLAAAVRAVLRRGWLDPDLAVLTRAFVVPGLALWTAAMVAPVLFARFIIANGLADTIAQSGPAGDLESSSEQLSDAYLVMIYRLSFPFMALGVVTFFTLWSVAGVFRSWKVRIRDEAYLIGERLHNFGVVNVPPKTRGAWRAGGQRL